MDDAESPTKIAAQIARLQAKLVKAEKRKERDGSAKGGDGPSAVLAGASPSPSKKKKQRSDFGPSASGQSYPSSSSRRLFTNKQSTSTASASSRSKPPPERLAPETEYANSRFLSDISSKRNKLKDADSRRAVVRSTDFSAPAPSRRPSTLAPIKDVKGKKRAEEPEEESEPEYHPQGNERDDDLALVHELEAGPREFKPIPDDPEWKRYEPNSGIRMKNRYLPHEELQEHLSDRYHIPPELLYSLVRPTKGGMEYELPVEGDWIIIGVLAEKSDIRFIGSGGQNPSMLEKQKKALEAEVKRRKAQEKAKLAKLKKELASSAGGNGDVDMELPGDIESDNELKAADSGDEDDPAARLAALNRKPRRYISFKLIDLRHRNAGGGSGIVNLKLFEADPQKEAVKQVCSSDDEYTTSKGIRMKKEHRRDRDVDVETTTRVYKGGSGGAYEKFWKEREGTVVAILNPRIMKPWQNKHNPEASNIISLTPDTAESMIVIGRSLDLGSCIAKKRDGNACGAWCDVRVAEVCEYHVQRAVKDRRAGRAEFFAGTGGMETTTIRSNITSAGARKGRQGSTGLAGKGGLTPYDPATKTGLLPVTGSKAVDGMRTFVVGQGNTAPRRMGGATSSLSRTGLTRPSSGTLAAKGRFALAPNTTGMMSRDKDSLLNPKEKAKRREREEKEMMKMLSRDGGKSLGAKYLQREKGGKDEDSHRRSKLTSLDHSELKHGDIRLQKRKLEAMALLEEGKASTAAPRLRLPRGQKAHANVSKPEHADDEDDSLLRPDTVDDWDDLEIEGQPGSDTDGHSRRPKSIGGARDDFMFSSDEEGGGGYGYSDDDGGTGHGYDNDDDDLVIEPPVTIDL